jgi:lipoprotein-releasing system permease protein
MFFELKVALRYFFVRKKERFISVISSFSLFGVAIGVAALIVVMAVMNGFRDELVGKIIGLNSDINVTPFASNGYINEYANTREAIENQPYVKNVIGLVEGQALAFGVANSSGTLVKGISLNDLKYKPLITENIIMGSISRLASEDRILLGEELAMSLGVIVGSKLKLIIPHIRSSLIGGLPRAKTYEVAAIFKSGMYEYDSMNILMEFNGASKLYSTEGKPNKLEVNTINFNRASEYADKLAEVIDDYQINDWQYSNAAFFNAIEIERVVMFVILSLIILVAAFNIISSLIILVKDKTKDIAILKTIGARFNSILAIFILDGMFIGVLGTLLGVAIGISVASNIDGIKNFLESISGLDLFNNAIYFLSMLPSKIDYSQVMLVALFSLLFCFLATIYPAYKAASIEPARAIREE